MLLERISNLESFWHQYYLIFSSGWMLLSCKDLWYIFFNLRKFSVWQTELIKPLPYNSHPYGSDAFSYSEHQIIAAFRNLGSSLIEPLASPEKNGHNWLVLYVEALETQMPLWEIKKKGCFATLIRFWHPLPLPTYPSLPKLVQYWLIWFTFPMKDIPNVVSQLPSSSFMNHMELALLLEWTGLECHDLTQKECDLTSYYTDNLVYWQWPMLSDISTSQTCWHLCCLQACS